MVRLYDSGTAMKVFLIACAVIAGASADAFGHHSNSAFQVDKVIELKGVVTAWKWANPHTWIGLSVDDGRGGKIVWEIEGRPPGVLSRAGWSRTVLKVGDTYRTSTIYQFSTTSR